MSSINIDMPFLNDLDELEFLEEFAGRPFVSEEEFVDAFLSLTTPDENNGFIYHTGPSNYNTGAINYNAGPFNYNTDAINYNAGPVAQNTGAMNGQPSINTVQAGIAGPHKKACKECGRRKMKCIIIAGTIPQQCEACQKRGSRCEFEKKKEYTRA